MSWQLNQLKYAFGLGGLMSFYGIVSLLVYYIPDKYFGGDSALKYKIIIVALVLLTLPIALVGMFVSSRRKKKAESATEAKAQESNVTENVDAPQKLTTPAGNYDELNRSAEETVQFLKSSNVGNGKDAVYALPWYIVAGTPKSGKTSLSLASGLNFQNLPSQRQSEQKFIRPTRNIDWRVTSDAVFLDTAGRYQTEGVDGDEWSALLETLKKYRGTRPLDGLILPISAERILHADDSEIEQTAKVLRARIDEAMQRTKIRFPIYLIFTHADAIEGFRDSFSTSQKEGENLVWGATIPLDQSQNAHSLFDSEFDLLQNSVMKRRLMRLSAPFPPARQLKIFNFPLHFGSARKKLGHFVSTLFRPNPFSESPFLRGFYFTAVPINRPQVKGGQTMTNMAQTVGQSYFTRKLYRDVILRDKDLVATLQAQNIKPPILGWLLTILGTLLVVGLLAMSLYSLVQNKWLDEDMARRGEAVSSVSKAFRESSILNKKPEEVHDEVDKIEDMRVLLNTIDGYDQNGAPIGMRFGFYSGNKLFHQGLLQYLSVVEQRFKKPAIAKLEDDLRKFAASNPVANASQPTAQELDNLEKNYDLLKAYLMLSGEFKDRAEATHLMKTLETYWITESKVPDDMKGVAKNQLDFYAKQVKRDEFPRIKYDTALVTDVRKKLQAFPAYLRYYKTATTNISTQIEPVSTESILAGSGVLQGSYEVPGAYTKAGYLKMKEAFGKAQEEITKEDWVTKTGGTGQTQNTDVKLLEDKYFNDYIQNWRRFIQGVNLPQYQNKNDAVNSLKALSAADSPMKLIIERISKETNLSGETESDSFFGWLWSFFSKKSSNEEVALTPVDKEFKPLFAFTASTNDAQSQITQYGNDLGGIFAGKDAENDFEKLNLSEITDQVAAEKGKFVSLMRDVEKKVDKRVDAFKDGGAQQDLAALLKKPIDNLSALAGGGILPKLQKQWAALLPQAREIEKSYPFTNEGDTDIAKLTAYLNPKDGALTDFYEKQLKRYLEESNGQFKVKADSNIKLSDEFLKYLSNAFRLRDALYGKGNTAQFNYGLQLQKVNGAIIELTIDGQSVNSDGTGSTTLNFPAQSGETGVLMKLGSTSETVSSTDTNTNTASTNTGGTNSRSFPGTWGLFKFFDAGSPKQQSPEEYVLTYSLGGKTLSATVKGKLFDRTIFTNVRAPEKF